MTFYNEKQGDYGACKRYADAPASDAAQDIPEKPMNQYTCHDGRFPPGLREKMIIFRGAMSHGGRACVVSAHCTECFSGHGCGDRPMGDDFCLAESFHNDPCRRFPKNRL